MQPSTSGRAVDLQSLYKITAPRSLHRGSRTRARQCAIVCRVTTSKSHWPIVEFLHKLLPWVQARFDSSCLLDCLRVLSALKFGCEACSLSTTVFQGLLAVCIFAVPRNHRDICALLMLGKGFLNRMPECKFGSWVILPFSPLFADELLDQKCYTAGCSC